MSSLNSAVSTRTACLIILVTTVAGISLLAVQKDPESEASSEVPPPITNALPNAADVANLPEAGYLQAGDRAPEIGSDVRFVSSQMSFDGFKGNVTVLDLWDDWCPYARELSPGLIELVDEYSNSPVRFVSLTVRCIPPPGTPERGWIAGYQAAETLKPFRCLFNDVTYGLSVHPTIYLIGPDGRILWCDGGMREQHAAAEAVEQSVRSAIQDALQHTASSD